MQSRATQRSLFFGSRSYVGSLLHGLMLFSSGFCGNDSLLVSRHILMRYSRIVLMRPSIDHETFLSNQEMKAQARWRMIVSSSCSPYVPEAHLRTTSMTGFITGSVHAPVPFGATVWAFSFRSRSAPCISGASAHTGRCFDYLTDTCGMLQPQFSARALR